MERGGGELRVEDMANALSPDRDEIFCRNDYRAVGELPNLMSLLVLR